MNDNDIIKALGELLLKSLNIKYGARKSVLITDDLLRKTLDLINRRNAEVERLQSIVNAELDTIHDLGDDYERALEEGQELVKTAKSEAIKEFQQKSEKAIFIKQDDERKQMLEILKTYQGTRTYADTEQATDNWLRGYGEAVQDILSINDNLVKEMTENDFKE